MPDSVDSKLNLQIEQLIRHPSADLSAYLPSIKTNVSIDETKATAHCYMIALDGNSRPRDKELAEFLSCFIIDYAIPRTEIEEAQAQDRQENSTRHIARLQKKARLLFSNLKKSGEGGELLLYLLAQTTLKLPQVLCKMSLKTSENMHVHGTDGLHVKYDEEEEKLALYWGESKLYQNFSEAIDACLESIEPYLTDDSKTTNRRDLQLFRDNLDLLDEALEDELLNFLNPEHPHFNRVQFRGVCLIGFDEKKYPSEPNQKNGSLLKAELEKTLEQWIGKVKEKIKRRNSLDSFYIEIFLVPLPSAQVFRDAFREEVGNG